MMQRLVYLTSVWRHDIWFGQAALDENDEMVQCMGLYVVYNEISLVTHEETRRCFSTVTQLNYNFTGVAIPL